MEMLSHLLNSPGINTEVKSADGSTAFAVALWEEKFDIADKLLLHGANVNPVDNDGETPFAESVRHNRLNSVMYLIRNHCDTTRTGLNDATMLHFAAANGNLEMIKILQNLTKVNINARDKYNSTPFSYASFKEQIDVMKFLLSAGADINAVDNDGETAIHEAIRHKKVKSIRFLLENNADLSIVDNRGATPLFRALSGNDAAIVSLLLPKCNALLNQPDKFGVFPLEYALRSAVSTDIIALLLKAGARTDIPLKRGYSLLHVAMEKENHQAASLLLKYTHYHVIRDSKGYTPLLTAVYNGNTAFVKLIIDNAPAALKDVDLAGRTALHIASSLGYNEIARMLIQAGIDVNIKDKTGETPLHKCAYYGNAYLAGLLLQSGGDINVQDNEGESLLHEAVNRNHMNMAILLIDKKIDLSLKNNSGKTARELASDGKMLKLFPAK